ncbi:non-ribosomal peptide synthetase, partial [Humidesulfovibrio sp.]|uniref:non-ribosomal peptide synthetase n=1 Tax=Humidesulfovibrio sp. TaxID=2910988 RepID=UPI002D7E3FFA
MNDAEAASERPETIPFNAFQKELWLGCQTSLTDYAETSTRGIFRVARNVSPEVLREAVRVVLRHMPLLGATMRQDGAEPCFEFGAPRDIDLRALDLRDDPDREAALLRFAEAFLDESVDEQFVRYALIRMAESECVFLFKCSHLALDGLGYFFHVSFLTEVYSALLHGEPLELGAPCSLLEQYEADEAYRISERAKKDVAFWEKHLERLPERRIFRALPGRPDMLGDSRHKKYVLSEETSQEVADILARRGIGPAAYFTALHALVVSHMCDEKDLVIQTPIAFGERKSNRRRQGVRMATPSLFLEMGQFESFAQLLEAVGKQSADFFRHVRTPFQLAMRRLPDKNLAHIADTFINYLPGRPLGTPDFPIVWIDQNHSAKEPVLLGALVMEECLTRQYALLVRNSRNHLSDRDVDRYVRRLEHLTHQLASGAELPQLDYLLDEERRELESWEAGEVRPYPVASLPALFDEKAGAFAGREAVRDEHGASLTYARLRENSLRCASWLAAQGVGKGDVVAVLARRTLHLPEIVLGIQRLGAVYLPVDPKAPAERTAFILADSRAAATVDSAAAAHADFPLAQLPQGPEPGDGAYLIYTSGSTGKPKGVLAPHGGFVNMIQGQIEVFGVGPEDRVLQFAPPIFDASLSEMFMALFAGGCLCPVGEELRNEPWSLRQYMADNAVTVVTFPPSYLRLFEGEPFPALRVLITAGEPPVAADALHYAGALRYFNAYGPTETCVCASMKRVAPQEPLPISSGRPIPNALARIVDRQGRARPAGMVGELWIGGASVALGYHNNPELTERRFRPLPGENGSVAYATGDLALWSEAGELLLVGRADDQVKIRGNRVELGEVTFLLESCPAVRQAAVLALRDASGQSVLAAFLLLRPEAGPGAGAGAGLEAVAVWSRENLPAYMVPSAWHVLESMPVTRTGKVDREALLNIARSPARTREQERAVDQRLLDICEGVLGRSYDPAANFFDQGGNSLLAMSLLHQLRAQYSVDLAFRDFVVCENLFDVEALLRGRAEKAAPRQCATAPLSRGQFRIWAHQQAKAGAIDYNMPLLLEAEGDGAERFAAALREAVEDQELLTSAVAGDIDAPHFAKWPGARIPLSEAVFPDAASAMAHFDALIHTPFDLRGEAPARIVVARVGDRVQVLLLIHHLVADGEALDIIVRNALERLAGGRPPKGSLAVQAEFCRREAEYLGSEAARADAEYWRRIFAPPLPPLNATPTPERRGAMAVLPLPPEVAAGLEAQAKASGVTVLACFVALLARFLCRSHGREELLLCLPVGLRETGEEYRTAGYFVSTVALRLRADVDARAVARQLREALPHSRHVLSETAPDFLATHAHTEPLAAPGFALRRLAPRLRASKFTGSFLLQTGETPCLVLEHDATFIPDGEALLGEFLRHMAAALPAAGAPQAPRVPRALLADAWTAILRTGPEECDDFFRAGGDSIKAIQITGMLHRNGLTVLGAPDFLRTPCFAELCAMLEGAAGQAAALAAEPLTPGASVPLLPIQKTFLRDHPEHWKIFHMLLPLKLGPGVPTEDAEAWLKALPERFQALGLAFSPEGAVVLEQRQEPVLTRRDFPPAMPHADMLRAMARELAPQVDPETGRTLVAGLATRGAERILVLVGHHLTLDVLSLDILQGDLERFLHGEPSGESCGMATRAVEVQRFVDAGAFPTAEQEAFWESVLRTPAGGLSALRPQPAASRLTTSRVRLAGFRAELSPSVFSDLLTALAVALGRAGQREAVLVSLKSHGRDGLLPGQDLSRSLGWFTALCPMPLAPAAACAEVDEGVRAFVRDAFTPLSCNAYGYLRQRDPDRFGARPQVGFNYLGVREEEQTEGDVVPLLSLAAPGDISELLHPDFQPDCALDLTAWLDAAGELHLLAYYPPSALPETWAVDLLEAWAEAVRTLPAYRPPLPEETLSAILSACACSPDEIERIAEPWPSHEPMLYQSLRADDGVYTQQIAFHFGGGIDEFQLMRAWGAVVDRHESLRMLFPMPFPGEFHRVVLRSARTSAEYHDLAHLPADAARIEADALLRTQRDKGFDLGRGPLLRAQFIRLDRDTLVLSWCFHHLLMDGWCIGILLEELFAAYERLAGRPSRPLAAPFALADYERWRCRFDACDKPAAKAYWAALLDGFTPLTGVAGQSRPNASGGDPQTRTLALDAELGQGLKAVAAAHAVTLSALFQALWALVLSAENGGRRDVVFGVVSSGRPGELGGVDRAVGLFIQTLPVRARWTAESAFGELLAGLKEQSLQQMRHGHLPLAEIGGTLLDHLLVFENYPFESPFGQGGPRLLEVGGHEKLPYPLGITIIPDERLVLRFLYDPEVLPQARVAGLMDRLHAVLRAAAADKDISCQGLEAALAAMPAAEKRPGAPAGTVVKPSASGPSASRPPAAAPLPGGASAPGDVEGVVREIYAAVLGHPDPSLDADFHLLGGHSLSVMSVMAQVAKRLNVRLGVDDIFANPTPRSLAARIRSVAAGSVVAGAAAAGAVSIPRVSPEGSHPLSASQRRIWFLQRLHADSRVYQISFAARLRVPVDKGALQEALLLLETRHEALRLRISADAPEQRLVPPGGLRLEYHEGLCPELTHGPSPMPLGLDQPLVRAALYRQTEGDFILYFSVHHIVFDGWSAAIVMREFNQAYAAALHGATPAWAPLELDYLSYAVWEHKQEPEGLDALRDALLPLPERLRLPLDYPRPAMRSYAGAVQTFQLGNSQGRQLKALANAAGVTLFPVLVAVVNVFLHRHTGQSDMIVGCPAASRVLPQTQNMVGLLVNTLAIRTVFDPEAGFGDLVRAADAALRRALGAQACPFEKLVEALGVERDLSRNPLFDVFVALEGAEWTSSDQPPLHMVPLYLPHDRSKFDLSFYFREVEPDTYEVHLEYSTELFSQATARAMCERLSTLIDAVLTQEAVPVCGLGLLPEAEQARLRGFNDTAEPLDIERHVDSRFAEQARKTPAAAAILAPSGQSCGYVEFEALVSALAAHLAGQGLGRGDYAAVCFERSLDMMACVFAVMRLGAVYVPLSLNLPQARLRSIFEDLGRCAVICAPERAELFAACGQRVLAPDLRALPHAGAGADAGGRGVIAPDDVAYVIFTSGSTGRPKGVQIEHRSVCNRLLWMQSRFPIGPGDVVLQKTTATFDVSVWELFWWSWTGAALALLEPGGEGDPARIVEAVQARGVTVLHFVPSMLRVFLDHLEARPEEIPRLSSLRYVFTSGEALPRELVARFNTLLRAELHNLYGPTEATVDVSWQPCLETPPHTVPIGRPISNTGLHVLDARLHPVPIGVAGELWISGVQVARGYVNRPELTAASFLPDPAVPGGRMYRTGD